MKRHLFTGITIVSMLFCLLAGCGLKGQDVDRSALYDKLAEKKSGQDEAVQEQALEEEVPGQETKEENPLYAELSLWSFHFCSGAGGWETYLNIAEDGSFAGEYYDGNMGEDGPGYPNGTMYQCVFNGQLGECIQESEYVWKVEIASMEYENEPDQEEIIDETKYIYTEPYGLEGLMDHNTELYVYLPGAPLADLPEDFLDWVVPTHFGTYVGEDFTYVRDDPEDLPFCGLYNTSGCGFYSDNVSAKNRTYLANRAKCPGLKSVKSEMHEDGTYVYEDMDDGGLVRVTNACIPITKTYNTRTDAETFVKDVLDQILGPDGYHDLYVLSEENASSMDLDKFAISGCRCICAIWDEGGNEDTRDGRGCFLNDPYYYGEEHAFAYAYCISTSQYNEVLSNEAMNFYLGSLELTGVADKISSASDQSAKDRILVMAIPSSTDKTLTAEEVEWVTEADTDLIEKYHLDPNEFYDDYQIGGFDAKFSDYPLDPNCVFYVQYPEDNFHKLVDLNTYTDYIGRFEDGTLMDFVRDENGNIVFVYEPYTP